MKHFNTARRVAIWIVINGALAWCAWAGVHGNEGAGRVFAFVTWVFAIVETLGYIVCPEEVTKKIREPGRPVPAWLSHGYDAIMIVFLVWHGWMWTAIGVLLMTIAEANIYSSKPSKTK